jgi:hypothetical protein
MPQVNDWTLFLSRFDFQSPTPSVVNKMLPGYRQCVGTFLGCRYVIFGVWGDVDGPCILVSLNIWEGLRKELNITDRVDLGSRFWIMKVCLSIVVVVMSMVTLPKTVPFLFVTILKTPLSLGPGSYYMEKVGNTTKMRKVEK